MNEFILTYLLPFATVTGIQMLGLMSPGPDFAMVSKMTITHGRRAGIYTALGFAFGISVHVAYSFAGIGYLMAQSIVLFSIVKYIGAAYLVYIGLKALFHKKQKTEVATAEEAGGAPEASIPVMTSLRAVRTGFLTNVLNPKATLFMFRLFTQVIGPSTPLVLNVAYAVMIALTTFGWFTLVATAWSLPFVSKRIERIQPVIERGMGAVLIALGLKIALPDSK